MPSFDGGAVTRMVLAHTITIALRAARKLGMIPSLCDLARLGSQQRIPAVPWCASASIRVPVDLAGYAGVL